MIAFLICVAAVFAIARMSDCPDAGFGCACLFIAVALPVISYLAFY